MALDPALLEILACPEDKGPLFYLESESALYNPRLRRRYDGRRRGRARASDGCRRERRDRPDLRSGLKRDLNRADNRSMVAVGGHPQRVPRER